MVNKKNTNEDAFVRVVADGGDLTFIKPNEMEQDQTIVGTLISVQEDQYENLWYKIATTEGMIGLNGSGQLDYLLAKVAMGSRVKIVYLGKEILKSGKYVGKKSHKFDVFSAPAQKAANGAHVAKIAEAPDTDSEETF